MIFDPNLAELERQARLRRWMLDNNITFTAMGGVMGGITGNAVRKALERERMPVRHHEALRAAYPDLPVELLPEARNTAPGPQPGHLRKLPNTM